MMWFLYHTLQAEDFLSQSIDDILQCRFIRHAEEMFFGICGDILDFPQKGLGIDASPIVVAKNLKTH